MMLRGWNINLPAVFVVDISPSDPCFPELYPPCLVRRIGPDDRDGGGGGGGAKGGTTNAAASMLSLLTLRKVGTRSNCLSSISQSDIEKSTEGPTIPMSPSLMFFFFFLTGAMPKGLALQKKCI